MIGTYTFSWKLMTLLPEIAGSWGLHLISITSSSGNLSPGSIGNRMVTHIHKSASPFSHWVTPQGSMRERSKAKIPSTFVLVIRHCVGSIDSLPTASKTGALRKLWGRRKKAVKVSVLAVCMQWMSVIQERKSNDQLLILQVIIIRGGFGNGWSSASQKHHKTATNEFSPKISVQKSWTELYCFPQWIIALNF